MIAFFLQQRLSLIRCLNVLDMGTAGWTTKSPVKANVLPGEPEILLVALNSCLVPKIHLNTSVGKFEGSLFDPYILLTIVLLLLLCDFFSLFSLFASLTPLWFKRLELYNAVVRNWFEAINLRLCLNRFKIKVYCLITVSSRFFLK